jgi:hypothetical protein
MIDDMEEHADGRPVAPVPSAFFWGAGGAVRIGNWFASWSDGSSGDAGIAVIDPPRGDSQRARRVVRGTFVQSASLWVELDHPFGRPVDLGAYAGITFWARLDGGGGKLVVAIESDPATGYFKARAANSQLPTQELAVAGEWQQVTLRFDEIGLRSTSVSSIDFVVAADTEPFTLWIDDLALFCRGACP